MPLHLVVVNREDFQLRKFRKLNRNGATAEKVPGLGSFAGDFRMLAKEFHSHEVAAKGPKKFEFQQFSQFSGNLSSQFLVIVNRQRLQFGQFPKLIRNGTNKSIVVEQ